MSFDYLSFPCLLYQKIEDIVSWDPDSQDIHLYLRLKGFLEGGLDKFSHKECYINFRYENNDRILEEARDKKLGSVCGEVFFTRNLDEPVDQEQEAPVHVVVCLSKENFSVIRKTANALESGMGLFFKFEIHCQISGKGRFEGTRFHEINLEVRKSFLINSFEMQPLSKKSTQEMNDCLHYLSRVK